MMRVLTIDNYDSFTFNLHQYIGALGAESLVVKNDELDIDGVLATKPDRIILSPGPGRPDVAEDFGVCGEVIEQLGDRIPLLGVCLGHQGIVHRFGGRIVRAPDVFHGKTSRLRHDGSRLFAGLPKVVEVMRYHSLVADESAWPTCLRVSARTEDEHGLVMAVEHVERPTFGIQFHPESIGTPLGLEILERFLRL